MRYGNKAVCISGGTYAEGAQVTISAEEFDEYGHFTGWYVVDTGGVASGSSGAAWATSRRRCSRASCAR